MVKTPRTYPYQRHAFGDSGENSAKNILSVAFGYTKTQKEVAADSATAILAATTGSNTAALTVTAGITDPDVARNLTVTSGGTAGDIAAGDVVVTGTNVEGATITESFTFTVDTAETLTGSKAFRTVESVLIHQQDGAGATFSVGTGELLGLHHRTSTSTVFKIMTNIGGTLAIENASADANSTTDIESNTVTPTTAFDGSTSYTVYYYDPTWHLAPTNDEPNPTV